MNARLVGEGVRADNRLVRLDVHPGVIADHPAGLDDLARVDVGSQVVERRAGVQRHDHFFEAGIARALADAVDGHFDLPRAAEHTRQRVRGRHAEVVVAVNRPDHPAALARARRLGDQVADRLLPFFRRHVADRIGDVEGRRAALDRQRADLHQKRRIGAPGVHRAELDIVAQAARQRHHLADAVERLLRGSCW